jgi:glycosyltransferase involved in cell wall biosynthesis
MPLTISIITPSYNQGRFIEKTIQSVLSQQISNLEYVIFDAASTDNTVEILKKYTGVVRWTSEKDKGQTHAVNKGIQATSGDIIGWLNSDDIYYPNAIKIILNLFEKNLDVDVIYGNANHIDVDDAIINAYPTEEWNFERLLFTCYLCQPAVFFRRSIVNKVGLLDQNLNYCMDYEYWLRLAIKRAKFRFISPILAGSRLYPETKTMSSRKEIHREVNNMMVKLRKKVPERWIQNYAYITAEETVTRSRPILFSLYSAIMYVYSSLKWNKNISKDVFKVAWSMLPKVSNKFKKRVFK